VGEFEQEKMQGHLKVENDVPKVGRLQNYLPLLLIAGGVLATIFWFITEMWTIFATFLKID